MEFTNDSFRELLLKNHYLYYLFIYNFPTNIFHFQKCSDSLLSNKTQFPTFARTMQPSNRIAKSIVSVLRHFKWNRVVVIAGENFMYVKNAFQVRAVVVRVCKLFLYYM